MSDNIEINIDEHIGINMGEQDWQEIVINEKLQLHITTSQDGICIDYYKYREEFDDQENYDDDFIGSKYFLWDDLNT